MLINKQLSNRAVALLLGASFAIGAGYSGAAFADDVSKNKGHEIAARSDRSDTGFESSEVEAVMTLTNKAGRTSTRELSFKTLERESEDVGDKGLTIFATPRDVKGTALLSHAKILA
ncbi:MAG: outer membrane lipoprotein-sorting protein, partial [Kordiimonadaceae bacterium]|nr:outer membrane lipoprotein-sorting protein [Kordiimonadaceae bacterium]